MAPRPLITCTTANEHCMEGTVCHCYDSAHMGQLIAAAKILFHCDNQTVVNIWEKGSTKSLDIMVLVRLLYFCAARYHIYICVQHIPGNNNNIADGTYMSLLGRPLQETCSGSCNNTRHHLCMANPSFHNCLMQLRYVSWCCRINTSNIPVRIDCLHILLLSFQHQSYTSNIFDIAVLLC